MPGLRVALLYNLKHNATAEPGAPPDALAEYDSVETVQALEDALRASGHQVIPLEGDETLLDTIRQADPDIAFNICEGHRGEARESQVPALLEMLGIPYTGSKILAHAISLDKAMTKRVWRAGHLRQTTPSQRSPAARNPARRRQLRWTERRQRDWSIRWWKGSFSSETPWCECLSERMTFREVTRSPPTNQPFLTAPTQRSSCNPRARTSATSVFSKKPQKPLKTSIFKHVTKWDVGWSPRGGGANRSTWTGWGGANRPRGGAICATP